MSKIHWTKKGLPILKNSKTIGMLSDACCCSSPWYLAGISAQIGDFIVKTPNCIWTAASYHLSGQYNAFCAYLPLGDATNCYWRNTSYAIWGAVAIGINGIVAIDDDLYVGGNLMPNLTSNVCKIPMTITDGVPSGGSWTPIGSMTDQVLGIAKTSDNTLYIACSDASSGYVKRWTGSTWESIGSFGMGIIHLSCFNDHLFISIKDAENSYSMHKYNGAAWESLGSISDASEFGVHTVALAETPEIETESGTRPETIFAIANHVTNESTPTYYWTLHRWTGSAWTTVDYQNWQLGNANCLKSFPDGSLLIGGAFVDSASGIVDVAKCVLDDDFVPTYSPIGQSKVRWYNCTGDEYNHCCDWTDSTVFSSSQLDLNPAINDAMIDQSDSSIVAVGGTPVVIAGQGTAMTTPFYKQAFVQGHVATYPRPLLTFDNSLCYAADIPVLNSPGTASAGGTYSDVNKP